jgi:hypothetical protein
VAVRQASEQGAVLRRAAVPQVALWFEEVPLVVERPGVLRPRVMFPELCRVDGLVRWVPAALLRPEAMETVAPFVGFPQPNRAPLTPAVEPLVGQIAVWRGGKDRCHPLF